MSAALRARAEQIFAWPALGIQLAGLYDRVVSAKRTGS
jgi:hypothetical protein